MTISIPKLGALVLLLAGGCATTQALHTDASTSAIRSAEELGAKTVPQAALHLQLAKEELKAAAALNAAGDEEQGKSMLLRSEADGELAVALSRGEAEKLEAQAALSRAHKLQSENPYAPGGAK